MQSERRTVVTLLLGVLLLSCSWPATAEQFAAHLNASTNLVSPLYRGRIVATH
eukprot:COSAG06_NODE_56837_length_283_cov_0.510870_1_plen_52_part_01